MIKIEDIRKSNELSQAKGVKKTALGESFADYLKTESFSEKNQVQATSAMTSTDAILVTQMIDENEEKQRRYKLLKRGKKLLQSLEEIRDALLEGELDKSKLIEISRLVKQNDDVCNDEKLREIMMEIELRVEVELAKLMR